jgi:hypothetical protein
LLRHALALFLIGLFAKLGWWQWEKGRSSHGTLQNLFYGVEWPIFAAAVVFGWWQMLREELHPTQATEGVPKRPPAPAADNPPTDLFRDLHDIDMDGTSTDDEEGEAELASYNRYLAALHERDTAAGPGTR